MAKGHEGIDFGLIDFEEVTKIVFGTFAEIGSMLLHVAGITREH